MYVQKVLHLVFNFYHAYTPYAIGIIVVLAVLAWAKPKAMAKLVGVVLLALFLLYVGGLIKQGIDSGTEKKTDMVHATEKQIN